MSSTCWAGHFEREEIGSAFPQSRTHVFSVNWINLANLRFCYRPPLTQKGGIWRIRTNHAALGDLSKISLEKEHWPALRGSMLHFSACMTLGELLSLLPCSAREVLAEHCLWSPFPTGRCPTKKNIPSGFLPASDLHDLHSKTPAAEIVARISILLLPPDCEALLRTSFFFSFLCFPFSFFFTWQLPHPMSQSTPLPCSSFVLGFLLLS